MTAQLLTPEQVAERLAVSKDYASRLMTRGDLAVTRVGRRVRCTEQAVADYIAQHTAPSRKSRKGQAA